MSDQLSNDLAALRIQRDASGPRSPWLRRIAVVGALGAAGWGAWTYGKPMIEAKVFKPEVEITQIVAISPAQAQAKLISTGYVVPQRVTKVGAKTPGRIKAIHVKEGDTIAEGFVIAELEGADLRAQLQSAKARVLTARAQVQTAKAELADATQKAKRERRLAQQGVGAAATAEDLEFRVAAVQKQVGAAAAAVRAAEAEVENFEVQIGYLTIAAPMAGTVVSKPAQAGELVGLQALPLVELADFGSLMVETDVPEARLHLLEIGGPAEIVLDAYPTSPYAGRVRQVSPKVNRAKATVTVKVAFEGDATKVLPEMAARVSFLSEELDPAVKQEPSRVIVPANAIAERGGDKVVFVLEDGGVKMRKVTLGEPYGNGFELVDGPPVGSTLVREPASALEDGQKVKQKGEAT
ncbi:MAG: efflux RND transporter periplasmic adaptor subunit [Nannocystaceae bacterium]